MRDLPSPGQQMRLAESGEAAGFERLHRELAGDGHRFFEPRVSLARRRTAAA